MLWSKSLQTEKLLASQFFNSSLFWKIRIRQRTLRKNTVFTVTFLLKVFKHIHLKIIWLKMYIAMVLTIRVVVLDDDFMFWSNWLLWDKVPLLHIWTKCMTYKIKIDLTFKIFYALYYFNLQLNTHSRGFNMQLRSDNENTNHDFMLI